MWILQCGSTSTICDAVAILAAGLSLPCHIYRKGMVHCSVF